jgi:hypothetical protein
LGRPDWLLAGTASIDLRLLMLLLLPLAGISSLCWCACCICMHGICVGNPGGMLLYMPAASCWIFSGTCCLRLLVPLLLLGYSQHLCCC